MAIVAPMTDIGAGQASFVSLAGILASISSCGFVLISSLAEDSSETLFSVLMLGGILGIAGGISEYGRNGSEKPLMKTANENLSFGVNNHFDRGGSRNLRIPVFSMQF
jgi:hypothetical protein